MFMKKVLFIFLIIAGAAHRSDAQTAKDIVTKAENNIHGLSSVTDMTIQVIRPSWTRSMSIKAWTKGEQYSLMVVTAPAKDRKNGETTTINDGAKLDGYGFYE